MDTTLLGYLLHALEPDEMAQVEADLRADAGARQRLQRLQRILEPLAIDLRTDDPPAQLWMRTLGRVAEYQCRRLPIAPAVRPNRAAAARARWRRADALAAAGILFCLLTLLPGGISRARSAQQRVACQHNLGQFYVALKDYGDRHGGRLPDVSDSAQPPRDVAGMFVPLLHAEGVLGDGVTVNCPGHRRQAPFRFTPRQLAEMPEEEFARYAPHLGGCYAYSLGHAADGVLHGPRLGPDQPNELMPILADRPPAGVASGDPGNSPNHGGLGQNVLFLDGHCRFATQRTVGYRGDDIYLNADQRVAAGKHPLDAVLADSAARP
jgi:prepilin-type processing-associated H-X9-DG protein